MGDVHIKPQIKEQLKTLPHLPGVYLMRDASGEIIYVGKSKNLKNRVSSYFRGIQSHPPKVQSMVVNVSEFEYIITDSEVEALILEANLIKKHLPRFNILLKDDKSYPYIAVTLDEAFPRVFMTRNPMRGQHRYFGPYTSAEQVRIALEIIQNIFPIRECNRKITEKVERPCLNYHIGRCAGVCNHQISQADYGTYVQEIITFLSGDKEALIKSLEVKMTDAASKLDFEGAATHRDEIAALRALNIRQKAILNNDKNQDYVAYAQLESRVCVMLFQVRAGKIVGRESYNISEGGSEAAEDILKAFMLQYYSGSAEVPKEIYLSESFEDVPLYAEWLTRLMGYKVQVTVPMRGEKRRMIELVERNAKEYILKFQEKIEQDNRYRSESEQELRDLLGMPENLSLRRIEAYDISNIGGVYTVGSMVVFEDGKKKRSDYRRYRVKSIIGQNDYGAMQEVLFRRFRRGLEEQKIALETGVETMKFSNFPDLILIDGGKGHVNAVLEVLGALNLYIPVAGMVKDDFHRTDDLYYEETLCGLKEKRQAFRFVSEIQEEVHRFAIEYHRSLRSKEMTQSLLDEIEGIGPKRRAALLKHFKSIEAIKEADVEALSQVKGMSKSAAESVYQFFYKKSEDSDSVIS